MTAPTECPDLAIPDLYRRHLSKGRASLSDLTGGALELSSHAAHVFGADGRRFLDCGGYGVFLVGHTHPIVVEAVVAQARSHPMSTRLLLEPTAALAAAALAAVTPAGLDRVHFVNSGAEATEAALKLARVHGKRRLVSAEGGFHGKTMGALSLTAKEFYQEPFRPLLPDVTHVPYGDVSALDGTVDADTCLFLEPVQGEGGVVVPPDGYLTAAQRLCRERGAFLVLDEIQTGLGRLGTWWGADREAVSPDVLLVGKGLSGGVVPVAAMVATDAAYEPFSRDPFLHTSTFAASPIAMAAARSAVETIRAEGMVDRAAALGRTLLDGLARIVADRCPGLVAQIRGAGLLIGVECKDEHTAGAFVMELHDRGVLVNHSLNAHKVIRFTPPAVLTRSDVDWLLTAFDDAATTLEGTL
ncbi:aminotransferase class III-fold pyridoxal phosphate-dependent enzyme [Streptomyces sp. NPDC006309]|uniref:aspartate aminotransferase family protein n=1 Tax=Streptomyces sp. NPDC006309 TaxID=3156749 RepID=UPI0033A2F3C5